MALDASLTSADLPRMQGRMARWARDVEDLTPFWRDVMAPLYLGDIQANFDQQGALVGGWAPLNPGYAKWKAERWGSHLGILELSLALRGSLQWLGSKHGGDIGPAGLMQLSPTSMTVGTSLPYAKQQHAIRPILFPPSGPAYGEAWRGWIMGRWAATDGAV